MMEHRNQVVIVTGASSGIGNACATYLAKKGLKVYGTCRNPSAHAKKADEFFELVPMDVTDDASVAKAAELIISKEGRIDAVICNAGMGIAGSIEDSSIEEIRVQMETNFLGTVRTIKAFIPTMRAAGTGRFIILSSIAGLIGMPFQPFYSASKFALEGLAESLRYETRPFGIEVGLVEPGDFRTGFTAARRNVKKADDSSPYKQYFDAAMGVQIHDEGAGFDPLIIAKLMYRLLHVRRLPLRKTVGPAIERLAAMVKRLVPAFLSEKFYRVYYKQP